MIVLVDTPRRTVDPTTVEMRVARELLAANRRAQLNVTAPVVFQLTGPRLTNQIRARLLARSRIQHSRLDD